MAQQLSQGSLILQYYKDHAYQEIPHRKAVDWATEEWKKQTGKVLRDPDRAIRHMAQDGTLIKVGKGVYKYDPDHIITRSLEDFTAVQKAVILKRDHYKCVVCGRGVEDGVELHVDHRKPKDLGGKATVENGQTLCAQHNFQKKTYGQTEFGKLMFIRLLESAKLENDKEMVKFCEAILTTYKSFNIDDHLNW